MEAKPSSMLDSGNPDLEGDTGRVGTRDTAVFRKPPETLTATIDGHIDR